VRVPLNAVVLSVQQLHHILENTAVLSPSTSSAPRSPAALPPTAINEEVRELLEVLAEQSQVMARILNDVLSLQKIEEGAAEWKTEPFALTELLDGLHRSYSLSLDRKHINFVITVNGHRWEPRGRSTSCHPQLLLSPLSSTVPPLELTSDIYRLRQIVSNFFSNAIKFTADSGSIELIVHIPLQSVDSSPSRTESPLSLTSPAPAASSLDVLPVRFSVKDSGCGLTEEEQQRLFQPYTQLTTGSTDRENVGSGLGLSICRTLVTQQGGTIGVESVKGHGSVFWFELPIPVQLSPVHPSPASISSSIWSASIVCASPSDELANAAPALASSMVRLSLPRLVENKDSPAPAMHPGTPAIGGRLRVMVVEDQTASLKLMAAALRSLGCDVLLARDGVECLEHFNIPAPTAEIVHGHGVGLHEEVASLWAMPVEVRVPCDVVLMDNFMPRLSGVKTVRLLRALGVVLPIIGCTGNAMREDIAEFEQAGATSVLSKPVSRASLKGIVQQYTVHRSVPVEPLS
jgi:signal transduction histidine kinase